MKIGQVLKAKDATYKVVSVEDKTVKRVSPEELMRQAIADDQAKFMNALYAFLKDQDDSVTRKKDKLSIRGFLLGFKDEKFKIWDTLNYNKERTDWKIPFPKPVEVWEFIKRPKLIKPEEDLEREMEENLKAKVALIRKLKPKDPTKAEKLQEEVDKYLDREKARKEKEAKKLEAKLAKEKAKATPPPKIDLEERRKQAINIIRRNKNPKLLADKLKGLIPHRSFNVFFGKLVRSYKANKMRAPKFKAELLHLAQTASFEEKPKPAPKFTGIPWFDINEMIYDDKSVIIKSKGGERTIPKSTFLAHYIIHKRSNMMVAIMKFVKGTLTADKLLKGDKIKDRFVGWEPKLLESYNEELYKVCLPLLASLKLYNPLDVVYKNDEAVKDLKVGDTIEVYWAEYFAYEKGKVISTTNGIEIRYASGEVYPLFSHQVKAQLWKKV